MKAEDLFSKDFFKQFKTGEDLNTLMHEFLKKKRALEQMLEDRSINVFYTCDNMEIIIQRIMPIASQIYGAVPHEVRSYIKNMINSKL